MKPPQEQKQSRIAAERNARSTSLGYTVAKSIKGASVKFAVQLNK